MYIIGTAQSKLRLLQSPYIVPGPGYSDDVIPPDPSFFDNFLRADEAITADTDWTVASVSDHASACAVRSNQLAALPISQGPGVIFCPDQGSGDQYVEFVLKSLGTSGTGSFVINRVGNSGADFVGVRVGQFFLTNGIEVYRRVNFTHTALNTGNFTAALDDVIRLECAGSDWEVFKNGVSLAGGAIGDGGLMNNNTRQGVISRLEDQNPWIDDFTAGIL